MKKRKINFFRKKRFNDEGFTFVETLAVLAIGAVLAAGAGVSASKVVDYARKTSARQCISEYKNALQSYYIDCGCFPSCQQGLQALWKKPVLHPVPESWNGPYTDSQIRCDPWGNSYIYLTKDSPSFPDEVPSSLPYVLISYGGDGKKGGENQNEDIVSWR